MALKKSMINNDDYVEIAPASVVRPLPVPGKCSAITDPASAVKKLEKLVNQDLHLLLTIARGLSLNRVIQLCQRERKRKPPERKVMIKYLGEQGIDTGECFTHVVSDMAQILFPNGSPLHSTLFIKNGNFRAAGEIVAASLAQNGPAPSFLEEASYKMLVNPDLDLMNLEAEQHLTPSERKQISRIREDVVNFQDIIIDHDYTGPIKEESQN